MIVVQGTELTIIAYVIFVDISGKRLKEDSYVDVQFCYGQDSDSSYTIESAGRWSLVVK